jgi:tetratricopeptide (TPR) repeat protein
MATCLIKTGDSEKALNYLKKGIEFGDLNLMLALRKNEIVALEYMGMYEAALKKLTDYRNEYPEDKEAEKEETFLKTRVD